MIKLGTTKELLSNPSILDRLYFLDHHFFPQPWTKEQWVELVESDDSLLALVYDSKNIEIAGFALFGLNAYDELAHLYKISIQPKNQGEGLSSLLLNEAFLWLSAAMIKRVFLEVSVHNDVALGLYKKLGFEILSIKKKFYSNSDDAYAMQRSIVGSLSS
mgnify:CR=1 FL=1